MGNASLHGASSVEDQPQPSKNLHPNSLSLDLPAPATTKLDPPTPTEPDPPTTTDPDPPTTSEIAAPATTVLPTLSITEPLAPLSSSDAGSPYHHRLQQFEKTVGPAVLREKLRGYERELVLMMAEDARFTETIAVKENHIKRLQRLLRTWSTTAISERLKFGDYYTQDDVKETLQRQTQTMGELRSALNCLKYEVETVRRRISLTWEKIENVEKTEEGSVGQGKEVYMIAGESNENKMQVDSC